MVGALLQNTAAAVRSSGLVLHIGTVPSSRKTGLTSRFENVERRSEAAESQIISELNLWMAVLRRAIQDAILCRDGKKGPERLRLKALRWLFCDERPTRVGQFLWIVDHLRLETISEIRNIALNGTLEDYEEFMASFK